MVSWQFGAGLGWLREEGSVVWNPPGTFVRFVSTISTASNPAQAANEAVAATRLELGGADPNLVLAFVSADHRDVAREIMALIGSALPSALLLGCTARSVIGGGREIEEGPGLALIAATLPGVSLCPFHVESGREAALVEGQFGSCFGRLQPTVASIVLVDPFSIDAGTLLGALDRVAPDAVHVGGLASGGRDPGENQLFLAGDVRRAGAVGVALAGAVEARAVVAQGCRPIGEPMFVTAVRDNVVLGLDGRPPLDVIRDLYAKLGDRDRQLCRDSLFLGLAMGESRESFGAGDFLVRNLLGADRDSGGLTIGAVLNDVRVVQFHLRDPATAEADLGLRLSEAARAAGGRPPAGGLLFSCLGRGAALYGRPDFETTLAQRHLGGTPIGGFFCNGEIGPVVGRTFLHGYTSSLLLLQQRSPVPVAGAGPQPI